MSGRDLGEQPPWMDPIAAALARFAGAHQGTLPQAAVERAKMVLLDTLAVALGAVDHAAARVARNYLTHFKTGEDGVTVWGTDLRASIDKAVLANGVPLRCYDYNDVFFGAQGAGHPSDMLSALICAAEWRNLSGRKLIEAVLVGYDVAAALFDTISPERCGWDQANMTCLAATCAIANLLDLNFDQTCEALSIAALQHLQSDEIESSALNRRGDLTMWKRFHGADAARHALDSCLLALSGAEGIVRPFTGRLGFLAKFGVTDDLTDILAAKLEPRRYEGIGRTHLKRWPVGSRGQSAIQSALDARARMPEGGRVERVMVSTEPGVYAHLVAIRQDPWRPVSRETADHSLPYIVGAAVLDGRITAASFELDHVRNAERADFIANKIEISVDEALSSPSARHLSKVVIVDDRGRTFEGLVQAGAGHVDNPFAWPDVIAKLEENTAGFFPSEQVAQIVQYVSSLENLCRVRDLTATLAHSTYRDSNKTDIVS